jgi:hypothetical protein
VAESRRRERQVMDRVEGSIRVWLDDVRDAPGGWVHARQARRTPRVSSVLPPGQSPSPILRSPWRFPPAAIHSRTSK